MGYTFPDISPHDPVSVVFAANAGAISADANSTNLYELSGVLTAQGALTIALPGAHGALLVIDNALTGAFPLVANGVYTVPAGRTIWYYNGTALEMVASNQMFGTVPVAMVANAAAFSITKNGTYSYEITGALTAQGNITATLAAYVSEALITFDNATTGNFDLVINGTWTVPHGRSIWYWNSTSFEMLARSNEMISGTLDVPANIALGALASIWYKVNLTSLPGAPSIQTGGITDAANGRFIIVERGSYEVTAVLNVVIPGATRSVYSLGIFLNGVLQSYASSTCEASGYDFVMDSELWNLNAGDTLELYASQTVANACTVTPNDTHMSVRKI